MPKREVDRVLWLRRRARDPPGRYEPGLLVRGSAKTCERPAAVREAGSAWVPRADVIYQ